MAYRKTSSRSGGRTSYAGRGMRTQRKSYGTGARRSVRSNWRSSGARQQTVRVVVEHVAAASAGVPAAPSALSAVGKPAGRARF